jgi:hypothetical protein
MVHVPGRPVDGRWREIWFMSPVDMSPVDVSPVDGRGRVDGGLERDMVHVPGR